MNEKEIKLKERDIMFDALMSQKFLTENYNCALLESQTPQVRSAVSAILSDEHEIENEIFELLLSRGWYETKDAEKSEISKMREKFLQKN